MMKKIVMCCLIVLGAAVFANPATAADVKPVRIGVAFNSFNDTWMMYMKDDMQKYVKTFGDKIEVTYVDGKEDTATQLGQVENFIQQGMNAIIVVPVDTQAIKPITDACIKAKIKLIYLNRYPGDLPEGVVYVGSDSIRAGILQMEYLANKIKDKGNVAIMMGALQNEAAIKRTEGVKEVCAKYPEIKITKEQTADWMRDKGMTLMENWISSGDKIDAVACNNDDMALGAIEALKAAGKLKDVLVGGVDATPDALVEIEKGNLAVTVFQNGPGQGRGAIDAAYALATGKPVDKIKWIPFEIVTPDNYKNYKK